MKTYTILYAEEVTHYITAFVEAENDDAAIEQAKILDTFGMPSDPNFSSAACRRIVYIETEEGDEIAEDIDLDAWRLVEIKPQNSG